MYQSVYFPVIQENLENFHLFLLNLTLKVNMNIDHILEVAYVCLNIKRVKKGILFCAKIYD